jgi:TatD DNase family protein
MQLFNFEVELSSLELQISYPKCLAIGEIGLDKRLNVPMQQQIQIFEKQVALSEKQKLPVIIHCVKAWNELKTTKKRLNPKQKWIFHGFSKFGILKEVLNENMMISIGANIIEHPKCLNIVQTIPNNRLLMETDDGRESIESIYNFVAEIKKISLQELEDIIEINFKNTFPRWHNGSNELNY